MPKALGLTFRGAMGLVLGVWGGAVGAASPTPSTAVSGVELQYIDASVRPQDDFYRHVNGKWLVSTQIPADKARYNSFDRIDDATREQLRTIVLELQKSPDPSDGDQQKLADLYSSFMNEAKLEALGVKPLAAEFARIDAVQSVHAVPALIAHFNRIGVTAPYTPQVHQDAKDSSKYVFDLGQDGLGMPDRDYYLSSESKLQQIRTLYRQYIASLLRLTGQPNPERTARDILALETKLARVQWTKVENRDPVKAYNKVEIAKLGALAPGYDWNAYLAASTVTGKTDYLVISQPSYITGFNKLLQHKPLSVWKAYFRWHLLSGYASYLNRRIVDADFAFYGTGLRGTEANQPRWKRGIDLVSGSMGEALGKVYVTRYFPPEAKTSMDRLVANLLAAYQADIDQLTWMGPATKQKARQKLAKFTPKIGYPVRWRDYSALTIATDDLIGNVMRANEFEYDRNLNKLGKPIDRDEWDMTPQTVDAYYNPERNEIVFPAAILQPPFFNAQADDAVNYGAIGAVIGHEISHGFDDEGSQYDGDGNLLAPPGWFTAADLAQFKRRTQALVKQYAAYAPVVGYPVDGELTLSENIADNSGLAIAYKAYRMSLHGAQAPVIDSLTGDQRFFMGWVQVWRGKTRDKLAIEWITSDTHSPDAVRGTLPVMNQAAFDDAFGIKRGDKMYLPPDRRVTLW